MPNDQMGRCRDCASWSTWGVGEYSPNGSCSGVGDSLSGPQAFFIDDADGPAPVHDGSQIVVTGPDFGCVQFEPKESTDA